MTLLKVTARGLYCAAGDFYVDPCMAVDFAVTTHAHSDHARPGSRHYLTAAEGEGVLRERLGPRARIESVPYGQRTVRNGVTISLHPAGHILGSAQVRVEYRGEVWVVSGDYKTEADPTCADFEPVRCHTFITESTFGLPIYRWRPQAEIFDGINAWWRANQLAGRTSVVFAYSLGKAQRVLAGVDPATGPIFVHGAVEVVRTRTFDAREVDRRSGGFRRPRATRRRGAQRKRLSRRVRCRALRSRALRCRAGPARQG